MLVLLFLVLLTAINAVNAKNIEISTNSSSKEINNFFNKGTPLNDLKLANGDTVIFQKGTYNGLSLNINKRIDLKAKGKVEFNGLVDDEYSYDRKNVAIKINSNKVQISGLKIYNYANYGIIINSNNNKVLKNVINDCGRGISVLGSRNELSNNKIQDNGDVGIIIKKGSKNTFSKNSVSNHFMGVSISGSDSNELINNNVKKYSNGIALYRSSKNTLTKNTLANCFWNGVFILSYSSNNRINQNKLVSNNCGIYSHVQSRNIIGRNTFSKNKLRTDRFGDRATLANHIRYFK